MPLYYNADKMKRVGVGIKLASVKGLNSGLNRPVNGDQSKSILKVDIVWYNVSKGR